MTTPSFIASDREAALGGARLACERLGHGLRVLDYNHFAGIVGADTDDYLVVIHWPHRYAEAQTTEQTCEQIIQTIVRSRLRV